MHISSDIIHNALYFLYSKGVKFMNDYRVNRNLDEKDYNEVHSDKCTSMSLQVCEKSSII